MAGRQRGHDQLPILVVPGGFSFGGPDGVEGGQVVGVGQVSLPGRGGGLFGAVAAEDVGEHGDRLALANLVWLCAWRWWCRVSGAFASDMVVAVQFGGGPGARCRVGGPGRGGEYERQVDVGAAGHGRVEPLPVLGAGDQRDAGVDGRALGGVPGDRVGEVEVW